MEGENNTPSEETLKTLKRLDRAWQIIKNEQNLLEKSKDVFLKEGEGMSIFRFLRPSGDQHTVHNCEYYYAEKDSAPWTMMLNAYPKKEELFKVYKKEEMYIICVSMPEYDYGDDTVQEIKVFRLVDNSEVGF